MTLHPAQERALAYLRRKGTEAPLESIRSRVERTFAELERLLASIDSETAAQAPDADTWCVQEVVDHLAISLEPAVEQLGAAIEGEPPGAAIPAHLISAEALERSWADTVAWLRTMHRRFLDVLLRADDDLPLTPTVPLVMVIKIEDERGELEALEWTETLDWKCLALIPHPHTLEHIDQIRRILARVS